MINNKKIVAVCTSRISDQQHHSFLEQLNGIIRRKGFGMMIFTLNSDLYWIEDQNSSETYVFDILPYEMLDCIVLMDEKIKSRRVAEKIVSKAAGHSIPVIVVDGTYDGTSEISFDYEKGFESVVRHVIEDHHAKKPHFIAGIKGNKFSDARLSIFRKVIEENGIPFNDSMVSYGEFWSLPARTAASRLISVKENIPDAVICANDIMAINVSDVFIKDGIKVPEQIIVTGFDGIEEALMTTPQLTTAGCDSRDLAEAVSSSIFALVSGKQAHKTSIIPKLTPNASCGCKYVPTVSDATMDSFNNKFYRYQDDIRVLYDISTNMQMSGTAEQAAANLVHTLMHDMCCVVDRGCLENGKNYFADPETGTDRCIFFDWYNQDRHIVSLNPGELVPDIGMRLNTGFPVIFNALDFMSKPFGYICYSYLTYDINEYTRMSSITNTVSMGLGGYINMHYQKYLTDKMTAELRVAAHMQENMLPAGYTSHELYEISASMVPAKNVSGDFYDFFQTDSDHLALIMADVSGKGVPAALFMAISKLVLHDRALLPGTPAEILRDVNRHICENNKMGLFITIWFGILDLKTGIISYASAGHEYPVVKLGDGDFELVRSDNLPPVGTIDDMSYEDLTIDMSGGGSLFIYTDGVTDIKNADGEHFGIDRVIEQLNKAEASSAPDVIRSINSGISEFAGNTEQFDDTTMMCIRFKGTGK